MANCESIKPKVCGKGGLYIPPDACGQLYIDGADDVTINQGVGIDLADGVHAYDGNGNEVEFTYEPTSIEKCDVGVHEVTYTARGETQNRVAHFCGGKPKLHMLDCGTGKVVVNRLVTILQAKAPKIYGIAKAYLERNQLWNPMDGVTAVDDNGNALEVTHSGVYDQVASGDIASFESVGGKSKSLIVSLEPQQDLSNGQPSADNIVPISGYSRVGIYNNVKRYGVKWDMTNNVCTERLFDASGITLDTTNFCNKGVVNPNYNNPFDNIYPWSEMKQCNVDLTKYRSGNYTLKECVTAWYGDTNFVTEGSDTIFVGRYRPEFWHTRYTDDDGNIIWVIADGEVNGYTHAKEAIDGIGFAVDDGNGGVTCGDGQPMSSIAVNQIQTRAEASGIELQNIYSLDAQIVLYLVEYGNMNAQRALGDGCSNLYRQNANDVVSAESGNTVTIPSGGEAMYIKGATIDFGASNGAVVLANRREVQSAEKVGSDLVITLDRPLDVSAVGLYASIHGSTNADLISDRSGYIGTNTKANVNYRGAVLYGNRYSYILGIYRQTGTNHIWLGDEDECINYNALNVNVHHDTGRALPAPASASWITIGKLNFMKGVSAFAPIREAGGNSTSPVGDQQYVPLPTVGNTVLLFGGVAGSGWYCGAFCALWHYSSGNSYWNLSACPLLK